jgi:hypothetical protein
LFEVGGSERCAYRLSFARIYAISTAGCTLSSKVPEPPRGALNLSPRPIPNRLGNSGSLGRNELVGRNRGQAEGSGRGVVEEDLSDASGLLQGGEVPGVRKRDRSGAS